MVQKNPIKEKTLPNILQLFGYLDERRFLQTLRWDLSAEWIFWATWTRSCTRRVSCSSSFLRARPQSCNKAAWTLLNQLWKYWSVWVSSNSLSGYLNQNHANKGIQKIGIRLKSVYHKQLSWMRNVLPNGLGGKAAARSRTLKKQWSRHHTGLEKRHGF